MVNPTESKTEQRALRRPVEHAGRLLELIGNDKPRWMVATLVFQADKTRRIGQLIRFFYNKTRGISWYLIS